MHAIDASEQGDGNDPLIGNPAIATFATAEGYKTSTSTMSKCTSPAINTGPELIGYYGRLPMTTKGRVRTWLQSRIRPVRQVAQTVPYQAVVEGEADRRAGRHLRIPVKNNRPR
jgi:hypothetical protein